MFQNKLNAIPRKLAAVVLALVAAWLTTLYFAPAVAWWTFVGVVICAFIAYCCPEDFVFLLKKAKEGFREHNIKVRRSISQARDILSSTTPPDTTTAPPVAPATSAVPPVESKIHVQKRPLKIVIAQSAPPVAPTPTPATSPAPAPAKAPRIRKVQPGDKS